MKLLATQTPARLLIVLLGSTALILAACIGMIMWVLGVSARSLDESRQESERLVLRSVLKSQLNTMGRETADFSAWTELYDHLNQDTDFAWEQENVGPYLASTFDLDSVIIVSRSGRIRYAYSQDGASTASNPSVPIAKIRTLARLGFAHEKKNQEVPTAGFVAFGGSATAVALATVRDSSVKRPSNFVLINIRKLDASYLGRVGRDYGLHQIHPGSGQDLEIQLPDLMNVQSDMRLSWQPARPGKALFLNVLPLAIGIIAISVLALIGLVILCAELWHLFRRKEAHLSRAELEASATRAKAAEEMSRSKSAFIANMSHELRTPLNAIIGFSEVIAAETWGPIGVPKYREYIGDIRQSGQHLLRIVDAILHISRIDAGKFQPRLEPLHLRDAVDEAVQMLRVLADQRGIVFSIDIPNTQRVSADRQGLLQILINLLSNAVKFSPDKSCVALTSEDRGDSFELTVADRGCGIPENLMGSLGQPFVQAENVYHRSYQGTGLGLSICFRLASAMSAQIFIESVEGQGTTVRLRLPKCHPVDAAVPVVRTA